MFGLHKIDQYILSWFTFDGEPFRKPVVVVVVNII